MALGERTWAEDHRGVSAAVKLAELAPPAPKQPAVEVDVHHPVVPRGVKSAHKKAVAAGWSTRLTRACGPRLAANGAVGQDESHTLALRCSKSGQRVVLTWRFTNEAWSFDTAFVVSSAGFAQTSSTAALAVLSE